MAEISQAPKADVAATVMMGSLNIYFVIDRGRGLSSGTELHDAFCA